MAGRTFAFGLLSYPLWAKPVEPGLRNPARQPVSEEFPSWEEEPARGVSIVGPEDSELVRRIKSGQQDLYEILIRRYQNRIFSLVYRILQSREDAEEVTNDAFVTAYRKLHRFREESKFYSWLYRIATNHALNRIKYRASRGRGKEDSLEQRFEEMGDSAERGLGGDPETPRAATIREEWKDLLEKALQEIDPLYRVVLVLRDIEGKSYEEVAEAVRLPLGTVKSRLHSGRAMLQKRLEKYR